MHKKFIKVTIERHDVTEDYDENFFDNIIFKKMSSLIGLLNR